MEKRNENSEWRSEAEEYELISNPTVFHNFRNAFPVDSGNPAIDTSKDEAVRTVDVSKWNFNEISDNVPPQLDVDTDVKDKMIETVQAVTCRTEGNGDKAGSKEVSDICSSSSVDEGLILNISYGTSTGGGMVSAEGTINVNGEMVRSELKSVLAEETVDAGLKEMHADKAKCEEIVKSPLKNTVLRSHLKRRYFDLPHGNWARCLDNGQDRPAPVNCTLQKRVKVRFLSRNHQHIGKHCSQGRYCFVCRGTFHQAHDCPKKQEENHIICLRCGDSGHDLFSCRSDYSVDDLKIIQVQQKFPAITAVSLAIWDLIAQSVPKLFGAQNPLLYATGAERKVILHECALSLGRMLGEFMLKSDHQGLVLLLLILDLKVMPMKARAKHKKV
ncbi:hypothetical protein V6N13_042962 [Hibiscus sabdariffa]